MWKYKMVGLLSGVMLACFVPHVYPQQEDHQDLDEVVQVMRDRIDRASAFRVSYLRTERRPWNPADSAQGQLIAEANSKLKLPEGATLGPMPQELHHRVILILSHEGWREERTLLRASDDAAGMVREGVSVWTQTISEAIADPGTPEPSGTLERRPEEVLSDRNTLDLTIPAVLGVRFILSPVIPDVNGIEIALRKMDEEASRRQGRRVVALQEPGYTHIWYLSDKYAGAIERYEAVDGDTVQCRIDVESYLQVDGLWVPWRIRRTDLPGPSPWSIAEYELESIRFGIEHANPEMFRIRWPNGATVFDHATGLVITVEEDASVLDPKVFDRLVWASKRQRVYFAWMAALGLCLVIAALAWRRLRQQPN